MICCEGSCSPGRAHFFNARPGLREVGYKGDSLHAAESASLSHTAHYFVRTWTLARTVYQTWACVQCGNERTYGAEEEG